MSKRQTHIWNNQLANEYNKNIIIEYEICNS